MSPAGQGRGMSGMIGAEDLHWLVRIHMMGSGR